jgi:hypothetical protein
MPGSFSDAVDDAVELVETGRDPRLAVAEVVPRYDIPADQRTDVLERVREEAGRSGEASPATDGGEPDVDGELLDELEEYLRDHVGPDAAVASAQIADDLGIDDREGQPRTREAIRILLEEQRLCVISSGNGYYVPESREQVADEVESLRSRAQSIQEREQLIVDAWDGNSISQGGDA